MIVGFAKMTSVAGAEVRNITVCLPLVLLSALFDVVIIVGALDVGFAPVSVVRELCDAAKPGNKHQEDSSVIQTSPVALRLSYFM